MDRRRFLKNVACATAGGATLAALPPAARRAISAARHAPAGMIVRNDWPEHWETSVEALGGSSLTPNQRFFVRSHFPVPEVDPKSWPLEVGGQARTPISLTLAELRTLPAHEQECVLECAGNGRAGYRLPSSAGTQWELGAVGNARWGGTRLAEVLNRAGVSPEVKHVWFECADRAPLDSTPRFLRSIPIETAMKDALLVWKMNGAPLPALHGAPVRVIVPGWFGMASAKWVTRIRLEAAPSDNHFMIRGYRYNYPGVDPMAADPVETVRVKSLITSPLDGARVPPGRFTVRGLAWAGGTGLAEVELGIRVNPDPAVPDADGDFHPTLLSPVVAPFAWRAWEERCTIDAGQTLLLSARATDANGSAQPLGGARVNAGGYGNNSIHQVTVHASV